MGGILRANAGRADQEINVLFTQLFGLIQQIVHWNLQVLTVQWICGNFVRLSDINNLKINLTEFHPLQPQPIQVKAV